MTHRYLTRAIGMTVATLLALVYLDGPL